MLPAFLFSRNDIYFTQSQTHQIIKFVSIVKKCILGTRLAPEYFKRNSNYFIWFAGGSNYFATKMVAESMSKGNPET